MNYIILTFPRVGSNYLESLIYQKTGLRIYRCHNISEVNDRLIISIIRNPEDTLRSMIAMSNYYDGNGAEVSIDPATLDDYVSFHQYLIDNATILVDYNDLISDPDKLCIALAKELGVAYIDVEYVNYLNDRPEHKNLVSSKTNADYDKINLSTLDLTRLNDVYADGLAKCLQVN